MLDGRLLLRGVEHAKDPILRPANAKVDATCSVGWDSSS
jgi:hypothetical protein